MKNSYSGKDEIDWKDLLPKLYAYTHYLLNKMRWFRGEDVDTYLKGKTVDDYVYGGIEQYLLYPEKYDPTKNRSLANYIKLHIIQNLVGNDARSPENKRSVDPIIENDVDTEDDFEYSDNILLGVSEAMFDQDFDFNMITSSIEEELKSDEVAEKIFIGLRCMGYKRREIIKDTGLSANDFDNGMRRLNTVLNNVAKKFQLKKPAKL
ncbi:MAG: hypothetical protein FVQ77_05255 [Cytophagales bacterium]|nr:hypothetical protein [Cytophagales bacterium]